MQQENKSEREKNLKEFSENNGFNKCFLTSAKTGENIEESFSFLIISIIKKFEEMGKLNEIGDDKKQLGMSLTSENHSKRANQAKKEKNSKCC